MGSLTKATTETFAQGGVNSTVINDGAITNNKIASDAAIANSKLSITFPTISSLSITNGQPAVYDTETVDINGTDFTNGARVDFIHSTTNAVLNLPTVTFVSATQLRVTVPASTLTEGTDYKIRVSNPDGLAATSTGTVLYSQTVTFSTSSGSLGSVGESESASFSVSASSNSSITYSVTSGSLPSGLSLNSSTGAITGTAPTVSADTTSTFTITATDAESQTASRSFSITVTNFVIANSLRFNDDDNPNLYRTFSSSGSRTTWTLSCWVKKSEIADTQFLIGANSSSNPENNGIYIRGDDAIEIDSNDGGNRYYVITSAKYRDPAAWYHVVCHWNTTDATASNRFKVYINGEEQTIGGNSYPTQNYEGQINRNVIHRVGGAYNYSSTYVLDGYLAEYHFIDGQALTPSSFGETDSTTNNWIPKKYTGTYGTNGFYLDFSDSSNLGADSSGNSNTFTASNLATADQTTDTPTNNFATFTPLNGNNQTLTEGNTRITGSAGSGLSTLAPTSGKWYIEYHNSRQQNSQLGVYSLDDYTHEDDTYNFPVGKSAAITIEAGSNYSIDWDEDATGGTLLQNSTNLNEAKYGMAVDIDNGNVYFSANGNWYSSVSGAFDKSNFSDATAVFSALPTTGDVPIAMMCRGSYDAGGGFGRMNFGNPPPDYSISSSESDENGYGSFEYAPPTGYLALCTNNLPNVAIADPTEYFNTVTYTGNGTADTDITGVGFQPDFLWIKSRSLSGNNHHLFNSSVGMPNHLSSDLNIAEATATNKATAFLSDGFTIQTHSSVNQSSATYVAWNWLVNGGTTSSNTDGTITSTVQANTTAGFSIVTYTGTGSNATVGHGLGKVPAMIIVKNRSGTYNWAVYHHKNTSAPETDYLYLNSDQATSDNSVFWNDTAPTSSVFTVGTNGGVNENTHNLVAYCFAEIEGYSKFGSYTGNGSSDGTFIYTGFKPAFVLWKRTDSATDWRVLDSTRDSYNVANKRLFPNNDSAENTAQSTIDFLSNGFKHRATNAGGNADGGTYIYMAFAEAPIKYGTGATSIEGTAR